MKNLVGLLAVASLPVALVGCVYEDAPPRRLAPDTSPYTPAGDPSGGGSTTTGPPTSTTPPSPMLVEVDTDQTMNAEAGQGVGVFIEYGKGGKWRLWWTCDTAKTRQTCEFNVVASVQSGAITEVGSNDLQGGFVTTPTNTRVEARVTTSEQLHGLTFTTNPGAIITVEAAVGGIKDGAFLFFVQNGKVNGGYQGRLTNPLQLQGKTP